MRKRIAIIIVLLSTVLTQSVAQSYKEHRGDIFYGKFNYQKAVSRYMQAFAKDSTNPGLMRKLAISHKQLGHDSLSAIWYGRLINNGSADSSDLSNYYIVLKNIGDYDRANEMLQRSRALVGAKGNYLLSRQFAEKLKTQSYRYSISLVNESSPYSDFSPAYFGNRVLFVSSRQGPGITKRTYARDGQPFLQLFIADTIEGGQLSNVKEFTDRINTRYHEGPLCYNTSDSTMYFTRNNFNGYKRLSTDGKLNLKIYTAQFTFNEWLKSVENMADSMGIKAKLTDKNWRNIKEFKYNSDEYSTGHPTLSSDGSKLYFVSDMPGGKGGTDIYVCERIGRNDWSTPVNLTELNTKGNEMFPFMHPSGALFFASDGLPGLGGLDIFKAIPNGTGFDEPENLGAPLNSSNDDFGLIGDVSSKTGYFSSNRKNGVGNDDLYYVRFSDSRYITLAIKVIDKDQGFTINDAQVSLVGEGGNELSHKHTTNTRVYPFKAKSTDSYNVTVEKSDYQNYSGSIALEGKVPVNDTILVTIPLKRKDFFGVYGKVYIKGTQEVVPEVEILFRPLQGAEEIKINTGFEGAFRSLLAEKTEYEVTVSKKDFFTIKEKYSTTDKKPGWVNLNEFVSLVIEKIDLNKTIEIPNIYYDLGKWNIRRDAAVELDKVVALLNDNPNIKIELGSHTDSRGNASANETLSQKRAQSAVDYIISKGISKDRITAKGYGESKLKNSCADGVKCSEEEHQQNRRTEIRVLSF